MVVSVCPQPPSWHQVSDRKSMLQCLLDTGSDILLCKVFLINLWLNPATSRPLERFLYGDLWFSDITHPIIGVDFLSYNLLVDVWHKCLINNVTTLTARGTFVNLSVLHVKVIYGNSPYHDILTKFRDIISLPGVIRDIRHATLYHIRITPDQSVHCQAHQLALDLQIARSKFEAMVCGDIVRQKIPGHLHSILCLKRTICGGYRALNARKLFLTGIPFVISIFRMLFRVVLFSTSLTQKCLPKFQLLLMTFRRPPLRHI